jgi:hypothetical protein
MNITATRERRNIRHLKQVARGLIAAGLYATCREALVKAQEVRCRLDEMRTPWADEPQPRQLRFRSMLRQPIPSSITGARYATARARRCGPIASCLGR